MQEINTGILLGLLASVLLLCLAASPAFARDARPNVLCHLEDWGPYLGCYGEKSMCTPNLESVGGRGPAL